MGGSRGHRAGDAIHLHRHGGDLSDDPHAPMDREIRRQVAEGQRRIADRGGAVDYADLEIERLKPYLPKNS